MYSVELRPTTEAGKSPRRNLLYPSSDAYHILYLERFSVYLHTNELL